MQEGFRVFPRAMGAVRSPVRTTACGVTVPEWSILRETLQHWGNILFFFFFPELSTKNFLPPLSPPCYKKKKKKSNNLLLPALEVALGWHGTSLAQTQRWFFSETANTASRSDEHLLLLDLLLSFPLIVGLFFWFSVQSCLNVLWKRASK